MPRIFHQKNAAQAKSYYEVSDYYENGPEELKGLWFGTGAELLGLSGQVNKEQFERLVDNLHPMNGSPLTVRTRDDRRVGADVTFSAPKSVSIAWGVLQDQNILNAVQESARETMVDMEKDAQTRVNVARNVMHLEKSGNIVGASWLHTTSRPVPHQPPDCNLHVHCWVANATMSRNRWTALDMVAMVRDSKYYEGLFQSRLASKIQSLGYAVQRSEHNFEICGISRATIDKFSKRTTEIEKLAGELGITDINAKGKLGAQTRSKKSKSIEAKELPKVWEASLNDKEKRDLARVAAKGLRNPNPITAKEAVDYSISHLFERDSVVRERQLITEGLYHGMGSNSVDSVRKEFNSRPWIREGQDDKALLSTPDILKEEQKLLAYARGGRDAVQPLAPHSTITREWLSDEQKTAIHDLLHSTDRLQIVRGVAGSGKTTLFTEAVERIEEAGTRVIALAPTAEATEVLRSEGFNATTLASFIVDEKSHAEATGAVLLVDEAGLIGTPSLAKLVSVAKSIDARIILAGDTRQHAPVERGHALRLLEEQAGIRPKEIKEIRRQQGEFQEAYRNAVRLLSEGKVLDGFDRLDALGFVHQVADDQERYRQLARDYADARHSGKSTLVIAPTHTERDTVTHYLRDELKARGYVHGPEKGVLSLQSKHLTTAERSDPLHYAIGDVVEFTARGKGGFKPGDRLTVTNISNKTVSATCRGNAVEIPLGSSGAFDVYTPQKTQIAAGDIIRITRNRRASEESKRISNGSLYELEGFTDQGELKLKNGPVLDPEWGFVDHGVAVTSYGSQGKTRQRIFVAQSSTSFPASSPEQAYVSASRGVERVDVYSDNVSDLRTAIARSQPKRLAIELQPDTKPSQFSRLANHMKHWQSYLRNYANQQIRRLKALVPEPQPQHVR
jgi:conjugative relaxase-like TrwC/TraI family protein